MRELKSQVGHIEEESKVGELFCGDVGIVIESHDSSVVD
jgi:hypothetical protein